MKPILLNIFLLLFISIIPALGQKGSINTLQKNLETAEDQKRVDILNTLTARLERSQPKQAKSYAEEAYKLSKKLDYPKGLVNSAFFLGILERDNRNLRKAGNITQRGIEAAQSIQDIKAELYGLQILKTIYMVGGNSKKLEEAEIEYKKLKNSVDLVKRNRQLSVLQEAFQSKEEALQQSEVENQKIQEELEQTREEKLIEEAKLARVAQEKAELELEAFHREQDIANYNDRLKRQRDIQILLVISIIIAVIFIGIVIQYFRLKRLSEADKAKSQRQLMMQEKMATLGQLTAGIAHEIQNPLNFVNNFAEGSNEIADELAEVLTDYKANPQPDQLELCQELAIDLKQNSSDIAENGQRISRIVRSMMEHAQGNKGKIVKTNINDLVKQNLNLAFLGFRGQHLDFTATIEEFYDDSIDQVEVIPQDLSRVFLNIFGNACYALYQKQQRKPKDYTPNLSVRTKAQEDGVVISIRDNGPGIPESIQKNIFTPFFSTKSVDSGNTGLGLSISYDIVVQGHHGKLDVNSKPEEYTEFLITLPQ